MANEFLLNNRRWFDMKEKNGYYYKILPRNNKRQEVCTTQSFESKEMCNRELNRIIDFLLKSEIDGTLNKYIEVETLLVKEQYKRYRYLFKDDKGNILLFGRSVESRSYAKKAIYGLAAHLKWLFDK